jgi:hypothetical protein
MSVALNLPVQALAAACQPNELDLRRVVRAIADRARYRYVTPEVTPVADGYLIRSPCCSRNIKPDGSIIEVALLLWEAGDGEGPPSWRLMRRDHKNCLWLEDSRFARIADLFQRLNSDPSRLFWQ